MSAGDMSTSIAVVGMACRVPGARNVGEFWRNLREGVRSINDYSEDELRAAGVPESDLRRPNYVRSGAPLADMEMFDGAHFGFSPRESAILDPQHRHFIECTWEALEDAGHRVDLLDGTIGIFAGSGHNAYLPYNLLTNPELLGSVGLFLLRHTGNDKDFLTTRVSHLLNLTGPSINVQTACSTSLVAVHLAAQSLIAGECDLALAGGVTIELPHRHGYVFEEGEILSPDGRCRAFDAAAQGTVFGSGVGVVVLRRLEDALADGDRIHAVIRGSAINNDGSLKAGYLAPSVEGQARVVAEAIGVAGVSPDTIGLVEAHGTGTPVGDPIEVTALTRAFRTGSTRTGYCALGSIKPNIGHVDTAAGVASLIKAVLAVEHGEIPPTLHFERPNPECELPSSPFYVNASTIPWPAQRTPRRAGVSSLGVGGTNAHVVVEQAPEAPRPAAADSWRLLLLSARSEGILKRSAERLASHLEAAPDLALDDVAFTLARGRVPMRRRRAVVCRTAADAVPALREARSAPADAPDASPEPAFMFSGGGAQYPGMGAELYREEAVYRSAVDECLGVLEGPERDSVRRALTEAGTDEARAAGLERPATGLPALFIAQVALARLWEAWGVAASALLGHSMGEYTAAHLAGVFSLRDALALVQKRGRLFERLPRGAMVSVDLAADALRPLLGPELSIAAVNTPTLTVASGPVEAIAALERTLAERDVDFVRLRIGVAAHSAMLEPIIEEFGRFVKGLTLNRPARPVVSSLTGEWLKPEEATDPSYWVRHLRETVRFDRALDRLLESPGRLLLEVGPGRALATPARLHPSRRESQPVLTSLRRAVESTPDRRHMLETLAELWYAGWPVDRSPLFDVPARRRVPLPTYPFERTYHWIEPGKPVDSTEPPAVARDPGDPASWLYRTRWERAPQLPDPAPAPTRRSFLILGNNPSAREVEDRLRSKGHPVVCAEARGGDMESLWSGLRSSQATPDIVVHLASLDMSEDPSLARVDEQIDHSFSSLFHLARSLGADDGERIDLIFVGRQLCQIAGERVANPIPAVALGALRVIGSECAGVTTRAIDLALHPDGSWAAEQQVGHLVDEVLLGREAVVALRGGERWVPSLVPAALSPELRPRIRERGVYLITGGLGGIGLHLAQHLAGTARARLVLTSRAGLPARDRWPAWLEGHGAGDPVSKVIRRVMAIEAAGAEVIAEAADVTDAGAMRDLVARAEARFGAIHGVIHAAGRLDDGIIALKSAEAALATIAPKVRGALVLQEIFSGKPLDFLVLFSSVSGLAGIPGQVDYAAANSFLDAFAGWRRDHAPGFTASVDWSAWHRTGMTASKGGEESPARVVTHTLDSSTDWRLHDHRLVSGTPILPGAAYLELVWQAMQDGAGAALEIRDLTITSPCDVPQEAPRALEVRLSADGEFTIRSRPASAGAGDGWMTHAHGAALVAAPGAAPARLDLAAIRARCPTRKESAASAETAGHLRFGDRWHNVREVLYGTREALVALELPARFETDLTEHPLHPALLDLAAGGAQELFPGFQAERPLLVPLVYSRVVLREPLRPRMVSHVRIRDEQDAASDLATLDVTIAGVDGTVLAELQGFVLIRVRDTGRLQVDAGTGAAQGVRGAPPVETEMLPGSLTAGQGLEAFDLLLAAADVPAQVIVSTIDAGRALAELRAGPSGPRVESRPENETERRLEAGLSTHPAVGEVAVVERRTEAGETALVAYLAYRPGEHATVSDLRRYLRGRSPDAIVPHTLIELDRLPRRPDGSIAREELVDPFGRTDEHVAPRTPVEQGIAEIWSELLGASRVGVHDNFFDLGGHSLLAVRMISRIHKRLGVRLRHEDVVIGTLEQLAAKCEAGSGLPTGRTAAAEAAV